MEFYKIYLSDPGPKLISTIKLLRAVTGCELKEAIDMIDNLGSVVVEGISYSSAIDKARQIESEGATYLITYMDGSVVQTVLRTLIKDM